MVPSHVSEEGLVIEYSTNNGEEASSADMCRMCTP